MPVATLSLGWDMLGAPESLPACLESGPHRLLDAPYTFAQRHRLPADLLVEGSLRPACGRKPYSPFRLACSGYCWSFYLIASPWGCMLGLAESTHFQCSPCRCPISQHLEAAQWPPLNPQATASSGPDGLRVWGGPSCTHSTLLECLWPSQKPAGQGGIFAV